MQKSYLVDNKRPTLSFLLSLHKDDHAVLKFIQEQLGAGTIVADRDSLVLYLIKHNFRFIVNANTSYSINY